MIPVKVSNISISNVGFVVFLKNVEDERTLPIFIGMQEAQSIAIVLNNVTAPRPLTHDLMKSVLDVLEARLERVEVHKLEEGTFHARLVIAFESQTVEVDSRPSDAIALALRTKTRILVDEKVMDEAGIVLTEDSGGEEKKPRQKTPTVLRKERVQDLKSQLAQAVQEERYEDAARLRDEIQQEQQAN